MNAKEFEELVGRKPERDDLDRVNCKQTGQKGHEMCGFCKKCNRPRYECGHISLGSVFQPAEGV